MSLVKGCERRRGYHRHVPISDQHIAREIIRQRGQAVARGVSGSAKLGLEREPQRRIGAGARGGLDLVGLMADHHDDGTRADREHRAQASSDNRRARQSVQHFRALRSHPGAEPGRKHNRRWLSLLHLSSLQSYSLKFDTFQVSASLRAVIIQFFSNEPPSGTSIVARKRYSTWSGLSRFAVSL